MSFFIASSFPNEMRITVSFVEEHCVFCWLNSLEYEETGSGFSQLDQPYSITGGLMYGFKVLFTQMAFLGEGEEPKAPKGEFQGSLCLWEPEW